MMKTEISSEKFFSLCDYLSFDEKDSTYLFDVYNTNSSLIHLCLELFLSKSFVEYVTIFREKLNHLTVSQQRAILLNTIIISVPHALKRREKFPAEINKKTFYDITRWSYYFKKFYQFVGVDFDFFKWSESYIKRDLCQFEQIQFELIKLKKNIINEENNEILVPIENFCIEMHIPEGANLGVEEVRLDIKNALNLFNFPEQRIIAIIGESWLFDPSLSFLFQKHSGLFHMQNRTFRYSSEIPENKTIKRIFGPEMDRKKLIEMPDQEKINWSRLQIFLSQYLKDPKNSLQAKGALLKTKDFFEKYDS